MQKIIVQSDLCDGCLDCEQACSGLYGASRITIREVEGAYYSIICQQCEDAPCALICPTEAISSTSVDQGNIDQEKCIACGLCMLVCPFGAINVENRMAQRCDRCECRGEYEEPACIKACSKRAISLIDAEEIKAKKQEQFLSKMAGINKSLKKGNFINIITSASRADSNRSNRSRNDENID